MEIESESQRVVETEPITEEPRRSGRILMTDDPSIVLVDQDEPTSCRWAIESPNSAKWLGAMESEMQSVYDNQVWTLVDPPEGAMIIECKWIFKEKAGNVFKGRLVAKGFRQTHGIDYDETFSPAFMLKSIKILLAIVAYYEYEIWQMDVKTAFLNGNLLEDV